MHDDDWHQDVSFLIFAGTLPVSPQGSKRFCQIRPILLPGELDML